MGLKYDLSKWLPIVAPLHFSPDEPPWKNLNATHPALLEQMRLNRLRQEQEEFPHDDRKLLWNHNGGHDFVIETLIRRERTMGFMQRTKVSLRCKECRVEAFDDSGDGTVKLKLFTETGAVFGPLDGVIVSNYWIGSQANLISIEADYFDD